VARHASKWPVGVERRRALVDELALGRVAQERQRADDGLPAANAGDDADEPRAFDQKNRCCQMCGRRVIWCLTTLMTRSPRFMVRCLDRSKSGRNPLERRARPTKRNVFAAHAAPGGHSGGFRIL
jgi:hypothetical protein